MKGIWVPISGQIAQQQKVDAIANNIANANTTGFKKDDLIFKEYLTALDNPQDDIDIPRKEFSPEDFYRTQGAENAKVSVAGQYTDFTQGQLVETRNPLDLGIKGTGFFEVLTPNGVRYTRNGIFTIDNQLQIGTTNGFKLLIQGEGDAATRVINVPEKTRVNVDTSGNIYANDQLLGKLAIKEFNDTHALRKEEAQVFSNANPENINPDLKNTSVHQGFVEESNVNAVSEMSELIKAHRHFETIQKAIQAYDSINVRAVNDISKF